MITGVTAGSFDLLHAGHCLMLKEAKQQCDQLIVLLHEDPSTERPEKNKPIETVEERIIRLKSNKYVDEIRTYKTEKQLLSLLQEINPDIRIIGADWKGKDFTGHELDIPIFFNSRDHDYSSSNLRQRIVDNGLNQQ